MTADSSLGRMRLDCDESRVLARRARGRGMTCEYDVRWSVAVSFVQHFELVDNVVYASTLPMYCSSTGENTS